MLNKGIELSFKSIPGCVLQIYVWLNNPAEAGTYALASFAISSMTTGFSSAMISFDFDVDVPHRRAQPKFYGYIPDDNRLRGRCFVLMTLISALHNVNRSVGCALLAAGDRILLLLFSGGEIMLYLVFRLSRGDFLVWTRIGGGMGLLLSFISRMMGKAMVDYFGCLHLRHPFELGGFAFSLSTLWAQISPFVTLQFYQGDDKDNISMFLICSLSGWLVLNLVFFCT